MTPLKSLEPSVGPRHLEPAEHEQIISLRIAEELDQEINRKLIDTGNRLAVALLSLGKDLAVMHASKGYKSLGYRLWEHYLESKRQYGRTYLSYLLRLGQAGELPEAQAFGLSGSQLVEYAKHTDVPSKIPQLIRETWHEVEGASVRAMGRYIREYVDERSDEFRKRPRPILAPRRARQWIHRIKKQLEKLEVHEQSEYLTELEQLLREQKSRIGVEPE